MAKALMDFYHKILQPELQSIKEKQSEHDGKFIETLGHLDGVHIKGACPPNCPPNSGTQE